MVWAKRYWLSLMSDLVQSLVPAITPDPSLGGRPHQVLEAREAVLPVGRQDAAVRGHVGGPPPLQALADLVIFAVHLCPQVGEPVNGVLVEGLGAKLSITNILDDEIKLTGGFAETYKRGRGIGMSLSYTPF
jgi:hypothetical protein